MICILFCVIFVRKLMGVWVSYKVGVTHNCHGPKLNLPSTCAVELQLKSFTDVCSVVPHVGHSNEQVTAWLFNIHFMQLYKELIKLCCILLTSSLCSLTLHFTWAVINLKSPLRRFRASLYRNSTLLFSLCNRRTLISMYFWFLCDTLSCCTDLRNNTSKSVGPVAQSV